MNAASDFFGDIGCAAVGAGRKATRDWFPDDKHIGLDAVFASVAAGTGADCVRFVHDEERTVAAGELGGGLPVTGIGMNDADVGHDRLGEDAGNVLVGESVFKRV